MILEEKEMHHGNIIKDHTVVKIFKSNNRKSLLSQMNGWLLDYFSSNSLPLKELPPLDDWTKSQDSKKGPGNWHVAFPDDTWNILIRYEDE